MNKKMMLLALSAVAAALFALPAVASATPAHIDKAETFTISSSTAGVLETTGGEKITCHNGVTGHGNFENTTTGTIELTFHGCTAFGLTCTSHNQASAGTITTATLPFHLIDLGGGKAGVLITPGTVGGVSTFASFTCGGGLVSRTVTGNGVIGTITSPECNKPASSTATLSFAQGATTGLQQHTTYTGVDYHLLSNATKAAQEATAQIHFAAPRTIDCTT